MEALRAIRTLCLKPLPVTIETHEKALDIVRRYKYRIYDALLISAALEASCKTLFSEDMNDGQVIAVSLTISPIRDPAGTIVGASTIARDITARKQAEAEVERRRREAESLTQLVTLVHVEVESVVPLLGRHRPHAVPAARPAHAGEEQDQDRHTAEHLAHDAVP